MGKKFKTNSGGASEQLIVSVSGID